MTSLIHECKRRNIEFEVFFTNQHFSPSMSQSFFKELDIEVINYMTKEFNRENCLNRLTTGFAMYEPDVVIVQGDTNSALYGALAAMECKIPIAHIEAGLRSFNFKEPFPEEYNRALIDSISTYLFCPTKYAYNNILSWNNHTKIHVVGNTIIDLIHDLKIRPNKKKQILITCHRRENWDKIKQICEGIVNVRKLFAGHEFIFVKHANVVIGNEFERYLQNANITFIEPQPYFKFIDLLAESELILSDSGGIVEEASYFKIPVAIMRNTTERMESVNLEYAKLVGTSSRMHHVVFELYNDYYKKKNVKCPYGNGDSAKQILDILEGEN